jgi:hypothetical protein
MKFQTFRLSHWLKSLAFGYLCLLATVFAQEQKPKLIAQTGHSSNILSIQFSADKRFLGVTELIQRGSSNGSGVLKIWETATGRELLRIDNNLGIGFFLFSPDSRFIALATSGFTNIIIYDLTNLNKKVVKTQNLVEAIHFIDSDNIKAITRSKKDTFGGLIKSFGIETFNLKTGIAKRKILTANNRENTQYFKLTSDGKTLATMNKDLEMSFYVESIKIFDLAGSLPPKKINIKDKNIFSLKGNTINSKFLLFGSEKTDNITDKIFVLDSKKNNKIKTFGEDYKEIFDAIILNDNEILSVSDTKLTFWNYQSEPDTKTIELKEKFEGAKITNDGEMIALVKDTEIHLIDSEGNKLKVLKGLVKDVQSIALSKNGHLLAGGTIDGKINLWDLNKGVYLKTLKVNENVVSTMDFDAESKLIAFKSYPMNKYEPELPKLYLVDLASEKIETRVSTNNGHKNCSIGFSYKGKKVICYDTEYATFPDLTAPIPSDPDQIRNDDQMSRKDYGESYEPVIKALYPKFRNNSEGCVIENNEQSSGEVQVAKSHFMRHPADKVIPLGNNILQESGNEISIFDKNCNKLLSLFAFENNDWLVTTPDGFFDGTPNAQKQILWRLNNNTFDTVPVEAFYYEYFYPGLLKKILAGEKPELPQNANPKSFAQKDIRQAEVRICQKCPCLADDVISQSEVAGNESSICLDIIASANFTTDDFIKFNDLAKSLVNGKPVQQKIFATFTPDSQTKLKNYVQSLAKNPKKTPDAELLQLMRRELGALLRQDDFFKNYQTFASAEIVKLAQSKPQGNETAWLNRRLLEDIFSEIRKGKISNLDYKTDQKGKCPDGELCLQDMRLFWNNRLIQRWREDMLDKAENNCKNVSAYRIQCQTTVPIVKGTENKFSAYLFNQDRVKSNDGEIVFK